MRAGAISKRWRKHGLPGAASKATTGNMAVNITLLPELARTGYRLTSPPDPAYNCIAYAAGITHQWWWPDPDGFDYWPPGIPRTHTLDAFAQALATVGFVPCADG